MPEHLADGAVEVELAVRNQILWGVKVRGEWAGGGSTAIQSHATVQGDAPRTTGTPLYPTTLTPPAPPTTPGCPKAMPVRCQNRHWLAQLPDLHRGTVHASRGIAQPCFLFYEDSTGVLALTKRVGKNGWKCGSNWFAPRKPPIPTHTRVKGVGL